MMSAFRHVERIYILEKPLRSKNPEFSQTPGFKQREVGEQRLFDRSWNFVWVDNHRLVGLDLVREQIIFGQE